MEKLKKFFKPVGNWLKNNWITVLIIVGIVLLAVAAFLQFNKTNSYQRLLEEYHEESLDHQQQIKELRTLMKEEQEKRDRILKKYLEEMNRIEQEYKEELGRIARRRGSTQDRIIRDFNDDPTTLTTAVTDTFGIPLVE